MNMTCLLRFILPLAFAGSVAAAGLSIAAESTATGNATETKPGVESAGTSQGPTAEEATNTASETIVESEQVPVVRDSKVDIQSVVEEAIEKGNDKLAEEADRVPGLKYDDISRFSSKIPGTVQIPDPTSNNFSSRAISVPGGLVSDECKHFARGFLAKRLMTEDSGLSEPAAMAKVISHLHEQRVIYAKLAGKQGLKRADVAVHDAECPVCGPLNAAEIACHKSVVKKSPIRELVMFDFASDVLRGGYIATVRQIKSLLDADPDLQVALIGRASIPGGPVPNFALSAKRITSVWNGLAKTGVPVDRIVAIPIGEDEPHIDLQLAIEYGLDGDFASLGQQPLNQSVYMVVFRPNDDAAFTAANAETRNTDVEAHPKHNVDTSATTSAEAGEKAELANVKASMNGDETDEKRKLLMKLLGGEIKVEAIQ